MKTGLAYYFFAHSTGLDWLRGLKTGLAYCFFPTLLDWIGRFIDLTKYFDWIGHLLDSEIMTVLR